MSQNMDSSKTASAFLLVLGLVFFPYGLYCFVAPQFLAGAAGLVGTTPTGVNEIRAMYGGLQMGFGLLLLAGRYDTRLTMAGLAAVGFVMPALALTRLLGLALGGDLSGYTVGALIFEIGSSVIAVPLLRRQLPATPRF